jgi:hypothetical protein
VHNLIEDNASLPVTVQMVNEKLKIAAHEAGIDLNDLENVNSSEDDEMEAERIQEIEEEGSSNSEEEINNEEVSLGIHENTIANSTKKLTEKVMSFLK